MGNKPSKKPSGSPPKSPQDDVDWKLYGFVNEDTEAVKHLQDEADQLIQNIIKNWKENNSNQGKPYSFFFALLHISSLLGRIFHSNLSFDDSRSFILLFIKYQRGDSYH